MYMYERRSMEEETEGEEKRTFPLLPPFLSSSILLCMYMSSILLCMYMYMHGIANVMSYCFVIHIEHNIVLYLITCTCTLKYLHTCFLLPPPPLLDSLNIGNDHTLSPAFINGQCIVIYSL